MLAFNVPLGFPRWEKMPRWQLLTVLFRHALKSLAPQSLGVALKIADSFGRREI
ncbi:MAG TPA: hypothetical protein VHX65_10470 [Pirellulales bacterium]|jgi:hypothetical protein|nr:hypothetical protein [Pirellulales bacterium]